MKQGSTNAWINESMEQWVDDPETMKHWASDSDSISQLISVSRGQFKEAASRCIRSFVFNALMPQCITCWVKQYSMNQWISEAIDHKRCVFWSIQQWSRMNEWINWTWFHRSWCNLFRGIETVGQHIRIAEFTNQVFLESMNQGVRYGGSANLGF